MNVNFCGELQKECARKLWRMETLKACIINLGYMEKDGNKVIAIDVEVEQYFCAFYRENRNNCRI